MKLKICPVPGVGDGAGGVGAEADDPGVALAQEELDQAVPALVAAGAVVAADPQWCLASHVSVPSLVAVGVRPRREAPYRGGVTTPPGGRALAGLARVKNLHARFHFATVRRPCPLLRPQPST